MTKLLFLNSVATRDWIVPIRGIVTAVGLNLTATKDVSAVGRVHAAVCRPQFTPGTTTDSEAVFAMVTLSFSDLTAGHDQMVVAQTFLCDLQVVPGDIVQLSLGVSGIAPAQVTANAVILLTPLRDQITHRV